MKRSRIVLSLALVMALLLTASGAIAAPSAGIGTAAPSQWISNTVTLVTGDRVTVQIQPDGKPNVMVAPADRGGITPTFKITQQGEDIFVIPMDAARFIPDKLDLELFNVASLIKQGLDDETSAEVPVILTYETEASSLNAATLWPSRPGTKKVPGYAKKRALDPINASAGGFKKSEAAEFGKAVSQASAELAAGNPQPELFAGVRKIWLDKKISVSLDRSTEQIGAPVAWAAGLDGSGVTVAVLDTGVDENHPDLVGKVIDRRNFTPEDSATDGHGHGTHCAGIIAGSGAGSDGARKGVAPGANLISGKVLDNQGSGLESWIIEGMTWATASGARVISMSLGSIPTDGTDPMCEAVNTLTAETGVLFCIAAGNSGPFTTTVGTPGSADSALTVGAVDRDGLLARFSSRGPRLGDYAIKPDITASGVGIASARASGTTLNTPIDDVYVALSGTSMATPHVAGAAAIIAQQHPDWTAEQIKALLMSAATPNPDAAVYDQGAGLVDLAGAIGQTVYAVTPSINFGVQTRDDLSIREREVVYRNTSDEAVTLRLALVFADESGTAAPEGLISTSLNDLTVEPGATASVVLAVDPTLVESGTFGGYLTATSTDGTTTVSTPVGYCREAEICRLTVDVISREGVPAPSGSVDVINVNEVNGVYQGYVVDGQASFWLPVGTYCAAALIEGVSADGMPTDSTFASLPEFDVKVDTGIVLDARTAVPVNVTVPGMGDRDVEEARLGYTRQAVNGGGVQTAYILGATPKDRIHATPTIATETGFFEFLTRWTLVEPKIRVKVAESPEMKLELTPIPATPGADGQWQGDLVFAGQGNPEDYAGLDVTGKIVLIERDPMTWAYDDKVQAAADAGARMLIVHNTNPGIFLTASYRTGTIPAYMLPGEQGAVLRELLAQGPVTIDVTAKRTSSLRYDIVKWEDGQIPDNLQYTADLATLATLETRYCAQVPNHTGAFARGYLRPHEYGSFMLIRTENIPIERPEYLTAAGVQWSQSVFAGTNPWSVGQQVDQLTQYEPGKTYDVSWWEEPVRPGNAIVQDGGNMAFFVIATATDSDPTHYGWFDFSTDRCDMRFYTNGELTGQSTMPMAPMFFSAEPADYRIELDVERDAPWWKLSTSTSTAWVVHPEAVAVGEELPMLFVDVDLESDLLNTLAAPSDRNGPCGVDLTVRYQYRLQNVVPEGATARLWISYDDGTTWKEVGNLKETGVGKFHGQSDSRSPNAGSGYLSIKVQASDEAGNQIEQTVIRAYALRERGSK